MDNFLLMPFLLVLLSLFSPDSFPERCLGQWQGTMYLYAEGKVHDSVAVTFTVARTDTAGTYTWRTDYLSPQYTLSKDYQLKVQPDTPYHHLLDEGDGIVLHAYEFGDKLYSLFAVQDQLMVSSYELRGEQLIFEISISPATGIPQAEVTSYAVPRLQRVVLKRVH